MREIIAARNSDTLPSCPLPGLRHQSGQFERHPSRWLRSEWRRMKEEPHQPSPCTGNRYYLLLWYHLLWYYLLNFYTHNLNLHGGSLFFCDLIFSHLIFSYLILSYLVTLRVTLRRDVRHGRRVTLAKPL